MLSKIASKNGERLLLSFDLYIVKISRSVNKKTDVGSRDDKDHARNSTGFLFCQLCSRKQNGAPLFGERPLSF